VFLREIGRLSRLSSGGWERGARVCGLGVGASRGGLGPAAAGWPTLVLLAACYAVVRGLMDEPRG